MLDDMLVANTSCHGFNWTDSDMHIPQARSIHTSSYALHRTIDEVPGPTYSPLRKSSAATRSSGRCGRHSSSCSAST